jgi:hydroxypyruvate reductase
MDQLLRKNAEQIARGAIEAVCPDEAVRRALGQVTLTGRVYLAAVGKAGWQMAAAAVKYLPVPLTRGIVVTKYHHVMGPLEGVECYEAGHPVPDENSYRATEAVLEMTRDLTEEDTVLFLLSGGGSALFEKPLVDPQVLQDITKKMLASGADIVKINTLRKRLSGVKGGRFALWCSPARVESIILSDILGDPVDMIASGPAAADPVTAEEAVAVAREYGVDTDETVVELLKQETPKQVPNVHTQIIGSVRELCRAAQAQAEALGYETVFLSDRLDGEASDTGRWLAEQLLTYRGSGRKIALLAGGETVVHLKGTGLGGRNQELALAAAEALAGAEHAAIISVGSDGTDGPTDAAGGYVDGETMADLAKAGVDYRAMLDNNDAYHALQAVNGLVITGPTGTNVNDVTIALIHG